MKDTIKLMLVDDHAIMRMGLASLLATCREVEVVGDAADGPTALKKATKLRPDIVFMDLMMPAMDGAETTRRLLAALPGTKVIVLTTFGTANGIAQALKAGASGALLKNVKLPELIAAVRTVAAGGRVLSPEIEQILTDEPVLPELSPRQLEILESITRGLTNEDIARQLGISVPVVKEHLRALFAKIGAANRSEAIGIALRKHLLKI